MNGTNGETSAADLGTAERWTVQMWGSHPDDGNDDHWTGRTFATLDAARAFVAAPPETLPYVSRLASSVAYFRIVLDETDDGLGGTVIETVRHDAFYSPRETARREREREADERADRLEYAREAGMLHGADAFNEAMGWDLETDEMD